MAAGAGAAPGVPAASMVHAVPAMVVQREEGSTQPPAGGPRAELPTMTAGDVPETGDGRSNPAVLADQVYDLLVRRLEDERKQRGW